MAAACTRRGCQALNICASVRLGASQGKALQYGKGYVFPWRCTGRTLVSIMVISVRTCYANVIFVLYAIGLKLLYTALTHKIR